MLEVSGLSKSYDEVRALDDCSFAARPGRLTGFVGPNGAGKTTAMRAIFGLVHPDAGEIRWRGRPVAAQTRRRFGYMPEERGLYPKMRVREQIVHFGFVTGMTRAEAGRSADRSLEWLGLTDRAEATVEELSHGNQQRVQLAVALVHDPELLVLDEPFAGLDPLAIDDLGPRLRQLAAEGCTVLFSSHQLDLVEDLCEDVVTVHRGRVVLEGPLDRLRAEAGERHLEMRVRGASHGWFEPVSGVEVLSAQDGEVRLRVGPSVDLRAIMDQAEAAGVIERFDYDPPTLSQLFRRAVGS